MTLARLIGEAVLFIFPAYCANAVPVLTGGGPPVDLNRHFLDGERIFGRNKTFRGFVSGLIVGTLAGLAEGGLFGYPLTQGLFLSLGALLGDLFFAFIKRRLALAPGDPLPVLDQIGFILGALLFAMLPGVSGDLSWELAIAILIVTPPIHLFTNLVAHKLGLKDNPW